METWRQSSHLASTTGQPDISIYVTRQLQRLHYPPPTRSGGVAGAEKDITGESPSVWSRDHLTYHMPPSEKSWNCAHWVRSKNSGKFRLYSVEYQYRYVLMSQWSSNSSYRLFTVSDLTAGNNDLWRTSLSMSQTSAKNKYYKTMKFDI